MALELDGLRRAVHSLGSAIAVIREKQASPEASDAELEVIKAGVIQNFEFTYELCWKFMKRWLEENYGIVAQAVLAEALTFLPCAQDFLQRLEDRNA